MNTLEYFLKVFPEPEAKTLVESLQHPHGDDAYAVTLASMPLESNCGDDCKKAIDNAKLFAADIEMAFGRNDFGIYKEHLSILFRVLSCYICG